MRQYNADLDRREFLKKATQAAAAVAISAGLARAATPQPAPAGAAAPSPGRRISYYCNGEIYVNEVGKPEGKPLTTGHMDFKPSWSKTGNHLVCFRRLKDDPVVSNWLSAIFIINADGTGYHELSDGTRADFNPTWTRDGQNTPLWNRKHANNGGYCVMQSKIGNKPGQEIALTDDSYHNWVHSCLMDGRLLVTSVHPTLGWGPFLMTRKDGAKPLYEKIQCELTPKGQFHRMNVSPSEKKVCFEFLAGNKFTEPGHTLYIADFDVEKRAITNLKAFANEAGKKIWFAYARWIDNESAVIYHSGETGKNQLYVYRLEDGSTKRVSTNAQADYRYPHGEAAPC